MIWYTGRWMKNNIIFECIHECGWVYNITFPAEKDEHVIAVKSSLHYNTWYDRGKVIKIYYTSLDEKLFTIQTN